MSDWCKAHPRYSAKRMPKSLCGKCWSLYFIKNPEERCIIRQAVADMEAMRKDYQEVNHD